jgi:hypothetical protein
MIFALVVLVRPTSPVNLRCAVARRRRVGQGAVLEAPRDAERATLPEHLGMPGVIGDGYNVTILMND